jgi:hypothetical protein
VRLGGIVEVVGGIVFVVESPPVSMSDTDTWLILDSCNTKISGSDKVCNCERCGQENLK